MDRITERTDHEITVREELDICVDTPEDYDNLQHILSVLAAYEDLGITPEQVREMDKEFSRVCEELGRYKGVEAWFKERYKANISIYKFSDIFIKYFEEQEEEKVNNWKVLTNEHADKWDEYQEAERQGTLLHLPCKVGDTVYVLAECGIINTVLDGTYETATGYYCPYELNEKCPHDTDDCEKCRDKTAVFEDTVEMIWFDGDEIQITTEYCKVLGPIGRYIFLTREEAEAKLKEMGEPTNG